ncbi:hypothetical protein EYC84_011280 [Monilinia fructicola]|uniref:Uncharacterized protein n=1 Tax=Monilinia fructicola TaxID=38448 RepID=A0A5M9J9K4_MONFR|nr:hypothetical protein EYC84_011280 [Monilinia fructicola]
MCTLWIIGSSKLPDVFWDLDAYSIVSIKKRSNMQDKISRKGVSLYRKEDSHAVSIEVGTPKEERARSIFRQATW